MQIRSASYNAIQAISAALLSWGLQTTWVIDPVTGDDAGDGTAQAPLKTLAEFNQRMAGNLIQVPASLQLIGDVLDAPLWLTGTRFAAGASLTVSGTVTAQAGVATISVVTPLNTASATVQPFQLTTTGKVWTSVAIGSRLSLSNGTFAWIRNVVDANNIVVGACFSLASASVVPTVGLTITLQTLSRALPPNININALDTTGVVTLRDASLENGNVTSTAPFQGNVLVFACEIKVTGTSSAISSVGGLQLRGCLFTMAAGTVGQLHRSAIGQLNIFSCVWTGPSGGTRTVSPNSVGHVQFQHVCMLNVQLIVQGGCFVAFNTSTNIQNTTTAIIVTTGGFINAGIASVTGSAGTGIGIDVSNGMYVWNGASGKPTISGATSDCRVGFVTYTYAALGSGKTAAFVPVTAAPTPVINTDATRGPGIATMSQAN